jgi:hypothetical protein
VLQMTILRRRGLGGLAHPLVLIFLAVSLAEAGRLAHSLPGFPLFHLN